jgi:hypothetical protein
LVFFFLPYCRRLLLPGLSLQFSLPFISVVFSRSIQEARAQLNSITAMYQITNIYALAAFGTIGGALFGFDVSSMSAWIDRDQYLEYFNHPNSNMQGGVRVAEHTTPFQSNPTNDRSIGR